MEFYKALVGSYGLYVKAKVILMDYLWNPVECLWHAGKAYGMLMESCGTPMGFYGWRMKYYGMLAIESPYKTCRLFVIFDRELARDRNAL